jgi:hypothetical protein
MKEFFKLLAGMFLDAAGKVSFKRVTGAIGFIAAVFMGFFKYDLGVIGAFLGYAAAAVGFSLGEKKTSGGESEK